MKKLNLLVAFVVLSTSIFCQSLIFQENIESNEHWLFEQYFDSEYNDTAFAGIENNRLIMFCYQGWGCCTANADFSIQSNTLPENNYSIKVFFNTAKSSYRDIGSLAFHIKDDLITIPFYHIFFENGLTLIIERNETLNITFEGEPDYTEFEQFKDSIIKYTELTTVTSDSLFNFSFSIKACGADGSHSSQIEIDSISVYDENSTLIIEKNFVHDNLLIQYGKNNELHFIIAANYENYKNIEIIDISGKTIALLPVDNEILITNLPTLTSGIYLAKITAKNRSSVIKFYKN
ncbi:MAG: T9SS type A sorting domain-containing protein [Salinivirgaceae bacterium]|nr:T9SS type A sorting domain-containing protein [Salinivirgaceae bacterium]